MSTTDIFISYSSEDRDVAKIFAEGLKREGFNVWWDAALHSGEAFDEVIEGELQAAKAVVVLWSPRSVKSRWVRAEATMADRRKKLVPAIIEPCDRPIIFELAHTIDLAQWRGEPQDPAWQRFCSDLKRLVGPGASSDRVSQPGEPVQPAAPAGPPPPAQVEDDDLYEPTQFVASSPLGSSNHWLLRREADGPEEQYVIGPIGLKIGRGRSSDLVLSDAQISRLHCMVRVQDGEVRVVDLNSTNGTFVDDERITDEATLPVGSILRVGSISLVHQKLDS